MAKNTVEYYSRTLGSGIINNAVSEATLQDLLQSLENRSNVDTDDTEDLIDTALATNAVLKASAKVFSSLTAGIANTAHAGKNFVTMIAQGENRLSAYGKFLQDDVIKKLPIVGEALGGFTSVLVSGVEALESWNEDLRRANVSGATFGHSLIEFKLTATALGLSTDELVSFVSQNNEKIVSLGMGTVTDGLRRFTKLSEDMFLNVGFVSDELDRMGYTSNQQNELLVDFLYSTRRSKKIQEGEFDETSTDFLRYAKNLDTLTKLTGKNRDQRLKAAAAASNDVSYQLKVARLTPKQQARMELALNGFAMLFGEQGAELFKSRELNVTTMNDVALALEIAMGPDFTRAIGSIQNLAKTSSNDAEFENALNNILGDQLKNANAAVKRLQPIINGAVSGNEDSKKMVKALSPVIDYLLKQGDMTADVKDNFLKQIQKIRNEQRRTDTFTAILRKFQRAVMKAYNAFMKNLLPVFKELAKEFKIAMIPAMITQFKDQLIVLGHKSLPYFKNFFDNLSNPEFEDLMIETFFNMIDYLKISVRKFIQGAIQGVTPKWLTSFLKWLGIYDDLDRLGEAQKAALEALRRNAQQYVSPNMEAGPVSQSGAGDRIPVKIGDTTYYVSKNFMRDEQGFFTGVTSPYVADTAVTRSRLSGKEEKEAVLKIREELAAKKDLAADDASKFGGYTLLQREALIEYFRSKGGMASRRRTASGVFNAFSSPENYAKAGSNVTSLINEYLQKPEIQSKMQQLREQYPNTYLGMNTGTLGRIGSLFGNFGKGTRATLHGYEAVLTPKQLGDVVNASSQLSIRDVVNRLNNNINRMVSVAKADTIIERSKLLAMT